ncbi:MAG TPA: glycosyltransferase [Firmicutes bacterium]|nr:glycosyltransferase [Bacillota bacterium]
MRDVASTRKPSGNKLTAMMVVRNEAGRYLRQVLDDLTQWVDEIVILDDASEDDTPVVCRSYEKVVRFEQNPSPMFIQHEGKLRAKLWRMVEETGPDWILAIDADEIFEPRIRCEVRDLINQVEYDAIEFRLFDFWGSLTHYRVDGEWDPWQRFVRFIVRYIPGKAYTWPDLPIHAGRWPRECRGPLLSFHSDIRVKHLGWVRLEEHKAKYELYRAREMEARGAPSKHTESIMAPPQDVKLEEWFDSKPLPYPSRFTAGVMAGGSRQTADATAGSPGQMAGRAGGSNGGAPGKPGRRALRRTRRVGVLTTNHFSPDGNRVVYGGAERYGIELTRLLLDMGFEVEWWQAGTGWERELIPGVPVRSIPEGDAQFQTAPRLNHTFHERATGIDYAIYFVTFLAYPQALEKSISISHGIYWDYPTFEATLGGREARYEWRRRLFIALAAVRKIVSVDTATLQWVAATWPGLTQKFEYIPNFVDLGAYQTLPEPQQHERIRVIFPRRLTSVRGVNEAARAAEVLTREYDNVEFHFVGRAHDDVLEKHMVRWASTNDRIFYYWRPPGLMPWTYRNMDIAVIPSKATEGTSLACLEAMGAGCAVIAGHTGGLSDLIIDGYNGLLIKPTVQNLIDALSQLIEDEDQRARLGRAAKEVARAFSLEKWRERWTRVITDIFT